MSEEELQKDPLTRGDFLGLGFMGVIIGSILTIPPAAFILGPVIKVDLLGQSDVANGWQKVASVKEIPEGEPKDFTVKFPLDQSYGSQKIEKRSGVGTGEKFTIKNAIYLSWKTEVKPDGSLGKVMKPEFLKNKSKGFSKAQRKELEKNINVMSNSCAHLGCPVRWLVREGEGLFLCPCHGGLYNINGAYVGGPPPRGLYRYTYEVRSNGDVYAKHEFDVGGKNGYARPFVV